MFNSLLSFFNSFFDTSGPRRIKQRDLSNLHRIHKSRHSTLYKATQGERAVVVKKYKENKDYQEESDYEMHYQHYFEDALYCLKYFHHPNIIALYAYVQDRNYRALVLEHAENGDLLNYLKTHQFESRDKAQCDRIALDIAKGLVYLHGLGYIHRDIKASNIVLDKDMHAKISDFDFTKRIAENETSVSGGEMGDVRWSAPERYRKVTSALRYGSSHWDREHKRIYTQAYDIYPLGWMMYLMQTPDKFVPFDGDYSPSETKKLHQDGKLPEISGTAPPLSRP